jgi:hypothetical protein
MSTICLNCGAEMQNEFCPHCGQKKDVKKLTWHSLVQEAVHFFSHIEHGFLNTSIQLFLRPGRVIKEYLEGKRKKYYKPISFYLVWAGFRLLMFNLVISLMNYENFRTWGLFASQEAGMYVVHHTQVFGLLLIPLQAFFIWIILSRPKMNYIETLAASVYASAVIEILIFFQIFIIGLLFRINFLTNWFGLQVQVVYSVWVFFCLVDLFKRDKLKLLLVRIIMAMIITFLVYQIVAGLIASFILNMNS